MSAPPHPGCGRRRYSERSGAKLVRSFPVGENRSFVWTPLRRIRVSAQKIKAAEDAAGNHNDDGDKHYRVKHRRAPNLEEAPSVLNNSRCTGSVRLNQETA